MKAAREPKENDQKQRKPTETQGLPRPVGDLHQVLIEVRRSVVSYDPMADRQLCDSGVPMQLHVLALQAQGLQQVVL